MKRYLYLSFLLIFMLGILVVGSRLALASGEIRPLLATDTESVVVSYQGKVTVGGTPYDGPGHFKFAFQANDASYQWSNAPMSGDEPDASVSLPVNNGLFNVLLGDTNLTNMATLPAGLFSCIDCPLYLVVWFSSDNVTFTRLFHSQKIAAVPYAVSAIFADTLDGIDSAGFAMAGHTHGSTDYHNVVVVAKSGGDFTSIQTALDSIADASASNPYLVWVGPGIYTERVTMKPFVAIEGAGEDVTKITYTGSSGFISTVMGANDAELCYMTVENTGGDDFAIAIYNISDSPRLAHVSVTASGGIYNYGIYNVNSSSPQMTTMTTAASGGTSTFGVYNSSSSPVMTDVTVTASGGANYNRGVYNLSSSSPQMTDVTVIASGGTSNYGVSNLYSSSPQMTDVSATASGGTSNYGVYNYDSSLPQMTDVTATASGGTFRNYGVYNDSSSPQMIDVIASGSGGSTDNIGVRNYASSVIIQGSTISADGSTGNRYGISNAASSGTYTVTVSNSHVSGETNSIYSDSEFIIQVGASQLEGGPVAENGGTVTYAAAFDDDLAIVGDQVFSGTLIISDTLILQEDAGAAGDIEIGERYRDNAIISWAKVASDGTTSGNSFGIQSVTHPSTGKYVITIDATTAAAGKLIPMAIAEIDNQPDEASEIRLVSVNQSSTTSFEVYINDGSFDPVNNDFVFMVTGR